MTRILYITQWYRPESEGPSVLLSEGLKKRNYNVKTITAAPNYPSGIVYPGYSAWKIRDEEINGIEVRHVPVYPSHNRQAIRRIINYLSFSLSALLFGLNLARKSDLIIVYNSPATSAIPALFFKFIFRKPLVLFIQDLWPDVVLQTRMIKNNQLIKVMKKALELYDRFMLRHANQVIALSEEMRRELSRRGLSDTKVKCIHNWSNEEIIFSNSSDRKWRIELNIPEESLVFLYGGNLGLAQNLEIWLRAFEKFKGDNSIYLIIVGEGVCKSQLKTQAAELKLKRVFFLEKIPLLEFTKLSSEADALIVSLSPESSNEMIIPGKVQACLALGRPVLASVMGSSANLLLNSGAAFVASPDSVEEIEGVILKAIEKGKEGLREMGARGLDYYLANLSSKHALDKIEKIIQSLTREKDNRA